MSESLPSRTNSTHNTNPADTGNKRNGFWRRLRLLFGRSEGEERLREVIEEIIDGQEGGIVEIKDEARHLVSNVLKVHDVTIHDVMAPRADIVAVDATASLIEAVGIISSGNHSRAPVYRNGRDDIIGMLHIKDVLPRVIEPNGKKAAGDIVRRILFAAPSMRVLDLLLEMRMTHIHMAVVVDEYGGVDGLVTIEDLVEEIIGEIKDEHDTDEGPGFSRRGDGSYDAGARVSLGDFENEIGRFVSDEEREHIDTLGGLVFALAGRVPARGEVIRHPHGHEFEIIEADPRRIRRLRIQLAPPSGSPANTNP